MKLNDDRKYHSVQETRRRAIPAHREDWLTDKAWADKYWPDIEQIIRSVTGKIAVVRPAGAYEDQKLARDYVVERTVIACRLRRIEKCPWRDMTIRTWRASGAKTEHRKIFDGDVRWYLYAWAGLGSIQEWALIDCEALRRNHVAPRNEVEMHTNTDGVTGFMAIRLSFLERIGAVAERWIAA